MSVLGECLVAFIFGSCVGVLVQRSRFCNAAALRDAMLFKSYRNTKALLVAMMILTVGFTAFMSIGQGHPMHFDVGLNQMIGLFIFGIGMVLAGACTVSTWVKAGEGNVGAAWALLFTFIGMFLFSLVWSVNYWPPAPGSMTGEPNLAALQFGFANATTLQEKFKIPAVVFGLIQAGVLYAIYRAIVRRETPPVKTAPAETTVSAETAAAE
ncbi:MAG: YeeE/YedE family protein [Hyphomicrobiales bacterium]|nr:YeeE/YedE family protein [Hyphomicrobiales bacterium]